MSLTPETAVRYEVRDNVAVLTIDFPPVNALGAPMRDGTMLRLDQALANPQVQAIVLIGANDRFVAGADISEFGKPRKGVDFFDIQDKMENSLKPIVCAIDGHALGGGLDREDQRQDVILVLGRIFRASNGAGRIPQPLFDRFVGVVGHRVPDER